MEIKILNITVNEIRKVEVKVGEIGFHIYNKLYKDRPEIYL